MELHVRPLLQIQALRKRFHDIEVLKGVDLDVSEREVVSIIGSSGSGKTTLLRCVNLLEEFDDGQILLDGESIGYCIEGNRRRRLSDRELSRQRSMTGMVFQSFNLFPHLTAAGNVMLGLRRCVVFPRTRRDPSPRSGLAGLASLSVPIITRANCPGGSSSALPSPARWP
jgi:polar amino acid transport system ATP-binding protein